MNCPGLERNTAFSQPSSHTPQLSHNPAFARLLANGASWEAAT